MSEQSEQAKPYAVIFLTTLRVARFDTKDEWYDAMKTLKSQDAPFVPVKYHYGAQRYIVPENWGD